MVAVRYLVCDVVDFNTVDVGVHNLSRPFKRIYLPVTARDGKEEECRKALEELTPRGTPVTVRDPKFQYANPIVADISLNGTSVVKELVERGIATLWNMPPLE